MSFCFGENEKAKLQHFTIMDHDIVRKKGS